MPVERCICTNLTFADLKQIASRNSLDFEGLCSKTRCCRGCTMCEPYIREMLRTGRTGFDVVPVQTRDTPLLHGNMHAEARKPATRRA